MEMIRRVGRRFCDDRILALRSLAMHHRMPMGLGVQIAVGAGLLANFLFCAFVMDDFAPTANHEAAVLFFLGETVVLLGFFVAVAGPSILPILERAGIAGVNSAHQQRFVFLEFATNPVTTVVGISVTIAFAIELWPHYLSVVTVLLLILSWLVMSAATASLFIFTARTLSVSPAALAIGCLLLLMLASLGPLALTGDTILRYIPLWGWTTNGIVALRNGDSFTALLWSLLQLLAAATIMVGLRWKRNR